MDDCQDRTDLLALFTVADKLHDRVEDSDRVVHNLKRTVYDENKKLEWLQKWRPMLEYFEKVKQEEKVVSLERARRSDANL